MTREQLKLSKNLTMICIKRGIFEYVLFFFLGVPIWSEVLGVLQDIVDTTPYSKLNPVTADGLIKVLLGGINRRIDEQSR
jgi:hypothetical protein